MLFFRPAATGIGLSVLLLIHCTLDNNKDFSQGNGSAVGDGMVSGTLFEPEGVALAKGVSVVVRHKNTTASVTTSGNAQTEGALYTTLTNGNGVFSFDTIPDGLYVIEGSDDKGNMVLYDSVLIDNPLEPISLPDDTLKPAGVITGTIVLGDNGNHLQVFVLAFGVDRFCQVQTDGRFYFPRFASGTYTLKILSLESEYETVDTAGIVVISGDTTDIGAIEPPQRNLQPVPKGVQADYDTSLMQAAISWQPTPDSNTAGYNIYRKIISNRAVEPNPLRLNGDKLCDSTSFSDNLTRIYASAPWTNDSLQYTVTMVDESGNESRVSAPIVVPVVGVWEFDDSNILEKEKPGYFLSISPSLNKISIFGDSYIVEYRFALYRYSHTGALTWYWKEGGFKRLTKDNPVIKGTDSGNQWFLLNFSSDDSVFVYRLSSSGFTRQFRIEPETDSASIDRGGAIINGILYYMVGQNRIHKIPLETGVSSPFFELPKEDGTIQTIIPNFDGGFVVNVNYEYLFFDADGNKIKTVIHPSHVKIYRDQLTAVDDSTFYFTHFLLRLNPDGSFTYQKMPYHKGNVAVRYDGTFVILDRINRKHTLRRYHFKKR